LKRSLLLLKLRYVESVPLDVKKKNSHRRRLRKGTHIKNVRNMKLVRPVKISVIERKLNVELKRGG
jgi:hypothetical protein